jgi:hypothetical protein
MNLDRLKFPPRLSLAPWLTVGRFHVTLFFMGMIGYFFAVHPLKCFLTEARVINSSSEKMERSGFLAEISLSPVTSSS